MADSIFTCNDSILLDAAVAAHVAGDIVTTAAGENLIFLLDRIQPGGSGIITSIRVTINQAAVFAGGAGYLLHIFDAAPTVLADNAVHSVALVDLPHWLFSIPIPILETLGASVAVRTGDLGFDFNLPADSNTLYGQLECVGGETPIGAKTITIYPNYLVM